MKRRDFIAGAVAAAVAKRAASGIGAAGGVASQWVAQVGASAVTPNIAALTSASLASAPWSSFLSATGGYSSWAINTAYSDPNGGTLRRLTNRSTVGSTDLCVMEYGDGGPRISQALGGGYYWFTFLVGTSSTKNPYFAKYKLGSGIVAGSVTAQPAINNGNLGSVFSQLPGEENILYIANQGSTTIHRYDCSAAAYASNSVFSGANASLDCGVSSPGWMQASWDGTQIVFQAPFNGPTAVFSLNPSTGVLTSYTGSATSQIIQHGTCTGATSNTLTNSGASWNTTPGNGQWDGATLTMTSGVANGQSLVVNSNTATVLSLASSFSSTPSSGDTYILYNVNEVHMMKSGGVVFLEDNNSECSLPYPWFPLSGNKCAAAVGITASQYGGHSACGATNLYTLNPNGTYRVLNEFTPGSAPASDGGAYNGSQTNYWGTSATTEPEDGTGQNGSHPNTSWNQAGAGTSEWWLNSATDELYNGNTFGSWSVYSGSIYQATITFANSTWQGRGVVGVLNWNGTVGSGSQITGHLTQAGSLGAMTAGTFYWNGSTTLYVWLSDGSNPSGKVIAVSNALATSRIAYYKQDGSQIKILCWTWNETQDTQANYYHNPYGNASPDGLFVLFNSDLGTYSGYSDIVAAELPTT
jgi:hypothetical protein